MRFVSYILVLCLSCFLLSGCDYIKSKKEALGKKLTTSKDVLESAEAEVSKKLKSLAVKYFPDNPLLQEEWVSKQLGAYEEFSKFIPDIPVNDFSLLRERAEAKYPNDYIEKLKYVYTQSDAYSRINSERRHFSDTQWTKVSEIAEKNAPDDYTKRLEIILDWKHTYSALNSRKNYFTPAEMDSYEQKLYRDYSDKPREFADFYERDAIAKHRFNGYHVIGLEKKLQDKAKADLIGMKELSYQEKYDKLVGLLKEASASSKLVKKDLPKEKKVQIQPSKNDVLRARAEEIFRQSIFTMRGAEEEIYTAALVKMNGKTVVLSTKHFIPEKFPVVFANSRGKIVCSKGYVSDSHPMILLIPDEEPTNFTPIEVVNREDSLALSNKNLFMIAPSQGGFVSMPVSVFSEDNDYLNLTSGTNPHTSYSTSVRPLGRNARRLLISVTETVRVGENSVVIDSETGKLVSMAIKVHNAGVLSHHGKTGNVIGHENFAIPDYTTFVRQFDGVVNKTHAPRSSIRFVRITAFESWQPLNIEKFQKQKNEIRIFTDDNNDFLMFFKRNSFDEALRSRRLARIAERYRKPLLHDSLTRDSFERYYRNYMIEVSFALKRELVGNKDVSEYYSIYRQEYKYQYKLRESMYKYLSEGLENKNIANIIHTDLTTRYNNSSYNGGRIGGSIGGGY